MKLFKNFMCMYIIKKHMRIYIYIYVCGDCLDKYINTAT